MSRKILIVEDEEKIARFVELELVHEGYEVIKAFDGRTGLDLALSEHADLIVLDVMLPRLNGLEVLRRIRKEGNTVPILLLTARDAVMDKVSGLDTDRHEVMVAGEPVELTNREFELLHTLMENKNIVMDREKLMNIVCGYEYVGETNIIDVYIRYLRTKIDDRFGIKLITTVRGVGYVIRES